MTQETTFHDVPFMLGQCEIEFGKMHLQIFGWRRKEEILKNLTGINRTLGVTDPEKSAEEEFERIQKVYDVVLEKETDFMHLACRYMGDRVIFKKVFMTSAVTYQIFRGFLVV